MDGKLDPKKLLPILKDLFCGNPDHYGLETSPVTGKGIAVHEKLSDQVLMDHLEGKKRVGIYPLFAKSKVRFSPADFDHEGRDKVALFCAKAIDKGLLPYLERSKRREMGFHTHFFYTQDIEARIVRKVLGSIAREARVDPEIFPKQDMITNDNGIGNYIYLPFHGRSVQEGRTIFLNPNFDPYPDQLEFLKSIRKTKAEVVEKLASESEEPLDEGKSSGIDVGAYLKSRGVRYTLKVDATRTYYLLPECLFAENHTGGNSLGDSAIIVGKDGEPGYWCFHDHCRKRTWADAVRVLEGQGQRDSSGRTPKNVSEDCRLWLADAFGTFTVEQCYRDLNVKDLKDKNLIRKILSREFERGVLEKTPVWGTYRKIDPEAESMEILDTAPEPLPIKFPGEVEKCVNIYPGNLIVDAGSSNSGKTAYDLNFAHLNRDHYKVLYFSSEMGEEELRVRLACFDYPLDEWRKITFKRRSQDFHQVVDPDSVNVVDYLEVVEGEFYKIGDNLRRIADKLRGGIALVSLQMDRGGKYAWGGQKTLDRARLYITLDTGMLTIVKGKNSAAGTKADGISRSFRLINGSRFEWGEWGNEW